jgi:NADPH-dependent glutamate synthase beta subunit-like oxidoreductase/ferredoxin
LDQPIAIRALKRFVTERFGVESFAATSTWHRAHGPVPPATRGSIGVVGGGPAGLAAACDLRLSGHAVTVYEAQSQLGGMMVLGIPEYRLPRALIAREIEAIVEIGIDVETGVRVGDAITFDDLLARHDALFLAAGTGAARDLDLPGHDLDGVLRAVEYLLNVNQGFHVELGGRLVVVGGGNVAFDAARTALRSSARREAAPQAVALGPASDEDARRAMTTTLDVARAARRAGVVDVTVVALESPDEIPADPEEIDEAEREGIRIVYRRGPQRFVGSDRVTGLETIAVASVFDEQGRFAPTFTPGTEEVIAADSIILAVGQRAELSFLGDHLDRTPAGGVKVDAVTLRTSDPRVWAGGDVAKGPRNLIDAIADGRRAAASIAAALDGSEPPGTHEIRVELRAGFRRLDSDYDAIERRPVPVVATDRRVGFGEVEMGYDEHDARLEGLRCLRCFDDVMLSPELCILCGLCVDVCPPGCITIVRADRIGAGTEGQSALVLDEDTCIRCGLCVNRCPPGALSMVHARELVP